MYVLETFKSCAAHTYDLVIRSSVKATAETETTPTSRDLRLTAAAACAHVANFILRWGFLIAGCANKRPVEHAHLHMVRVCKDEARLTGVLCAKSKLLYMLRWRTTSRVGGGV